MASPSRLPSVRARPGAASGRSRPVSMIEGPMLNLHLNPPKQSSTTSKSAKRRSLLPQFSRKASSEERDTIKEDEEADDASTTAGSVLQEPYEATQDADKKAMPPPSRLSRPTSVYGPGGLGRAPSLRSHTRDTSKSTDARADALAKLTGSAPSTTTKSAVTESGLKRTSSTRLPQGPAPRGLSRTASVKPKESHSRSSSTSTTTTSVADKRTSVGKARPLSIDNAARNHAPSVQPPASPASSTTPRQSITRSHMPPPSRPSFSTYQQHYSPAKSALPKPPLPSARPPKPTAPVPEEELPPMTFEVAKQQIELLQLSLLHQAATKTMREYEVSAKRKLGRKQAKLVKEQEIIKALELEQQRVVNLTALEAWCADPPLLAENLQILSKVYTELSTAVEEASRYSQLATAFESWIAADADAAHSNFVEALPPEWHKAHTSLALRLRSLQRELETLPPPVPAANGAPSSSLEILILCCRGLLSGMLRELEVMTKLEKGMLEREKRRVEGEVKALTLGHGSIAQDASVAWVPAWQSVA